MRAVVTRVSRARLTIDGREGGGIDRGLLVLLGIRDADGEDDCALLARKCAQMRIFEDEHGKMNLSLADVGGAMMVVSNFTLYADCSHGRRPDFFGAARPEVAIPLYERFLRELALHDVPVVTGEFGAHMCIDHVNDGPVTLILDTEQMKKR